MWIDDIVCLYSEKTFRIRHHRGHRELTCCANRIPEVYYLGLDIKVVVLFVFVLEFELLTQDSTDAAQQGEPVCSGSSDSGILYDVVDGSSTSPYDITTSGDGCHDDADEMTNQTAETSAGDDTAAAQAPVIESVEENMSDKENLIGNRKTLLI